MNFKNAIVVATMVLAFSGCATMKQNFHLTVDQTAQSFFDDIQKADYDAAYGLFDKGLSQRVSQDQFEQFMQTLRQQWGRLESDDTEVMPFHRRIGEQDFIPLKVAPEKIKRYVFDVKFEDAEMNFDLTLAPDGDIYKIVWFSVWGSSIYMTPQVQEKIEELFSTPNSGGGQG